MAETQTFYKPGLIFLSKHAGYVVHCKDPVWHQYGDGSREQIRTSLVADFMEGLVGSRVNGGGSTPVIGMDGYSQPNVHMDIRGGAFDLDATAEAKGWTEDERETVARKLTMIATNPRLEGYGDIWLFEAPKPEKPWKAYDSTHHAKVAEIAQATGTIAEALTYERVNKNRPAVVKALEEALNVDAPVAEDESLSAA